MLNRLKEIFKQKENDTPLKREIVLKIRKIKKDKEINELLKLNLEELKTIYFNLLTQKETRETTYKIPKPSKPIVEIDKRNQNKIVYEKISKIEKAKNKQKKPNRDKYLLYKKGKDYEKFVAKHFEKLGYIIKFNGIEKQVKDSSIDLIAIKKDEIILIQCKNWNAKNGYRLNHKDIKAFIGDTLFFIEENPQYKDYNIKRLFVVSEKILDKSAINYIKEHKDKIRYLLLPTSKK